MHMYWGKVCDSEETEDVDRDEDARIGIEAVIEEFTQGSTGTRSSCLFSIQAVQGVGDPKVYSRDQPQPFWNWIIDCIGRFKVVVIVREEEEVQHGEEETGKSHDIWRHPPGKVLDQPIPERVHHMDTEYTRVNAAIL